MSRACCFLAAFLLATTAAAAMVAPDLADAARRLERFPALTGEKSDSRRLQGFFELYWFIRMREFPDLATYVGYPGVDDRLPDRSPEMLALIHRLPHQELAALVSIDRSRLTLAEQVDYDLAHRRFEMEIEGERFHGLDPFHIDYLVLGRFSSGILSYVALPSLMPARTVRDYDNMLARLRAIPGAVEQALALLDEGLRRGITPPRVTLLDQAGQIQALLSADPLASPVLEPFRQLPETLLAAERERLRREAGQVFQEAVAPALRRLLDYVAKVYVPGARESTAWSALPDGRAWYAYLVRYHTTTDLGPEEIHRLGLSEVRRIRREMDALVAGTGFQGTFEDFCRFLRTDPRFFYDRPEDLVAGYRDIAKRIDPELVKLFGRLPRLPYGVTAMAGEEAKTAPTAFYGNGSLAAGRPGWFHANTYDLKSRPKWEMEALTLHEAVPGHHLQYALVEELAGLPEWRRWDVYPAFSEGWGLYAESLGSELGLYRDPYSKFGQLTYEMWRAIRLVVDTGLHAMGWTRRQAIDFCRANAARSEHEIEVEIDRYIEQPASALAYKLGELKLRELRAFAQTELGPRFDLRAFHDRLLGSGQLPLDLLEHNLKEWVAQEKDRHNGTQRPAASPSPTTGRLPPGRHLRSRSSYLEAHFLGSKMGFDPSYEEVRAAARLRVGSTAARPAWTRRAAGPNPRATRSSIFSSAARAAASPASCLYMSSRNSRVPSGSTHAV
jgi:uncharacterized protein (DUF885 family)